MIRETKHGLANVGNFNGRDARQTFWFYVLFLVLVQFAVGLLIAIPAMVSAVGTTMDAAQAGADPEAVQAQMMAEMGAQMGSMMWLSIGLSVLMTVLFVAAFVRRLHDGGFTGWIAVIPVAIQAFAVYYSIEQTAQMQEIFTSGVDLVEMQRMQAEITSNPLNYLSYLGYLVVIGFGIIKSQDGPNQYGEKPQTI